MSKWVRIPDAGVSVKVSHDWDALGRSFADLRSDDQAQFLETAAERLRSLPGVDGEMQLQIIADWINDPNNAFSVRDIRWFLGGVLDRLVDV